MKLHLYVARRFLGTFLIVLGALSAIYLVLGLVENLRGFGDAAGIGPIARLTFLNLPGFLYQILPLAVILATLFLFLGLSRTSEMVVTRAAGRPALVTLMAPLAVAFVLGLAALVLLKPIVAATSVQGERLAQRLGGEEASVVSVSDEGLWLRQGDAAGQTVIHARRASADGLELYDVTFFAYSRAGVPRSRIAASRARLEQGRWALEEVKIWNLAELSNPERDAVRTKRYWLASTLTPDRISSSLDSPASILLWEMPGFIRQLQEAGFSTRRHQVWFQTELASPLFLVAMAMIGGALTMRHARLGRSGLMALGALFFGFGIYFIRNFATILGENGQIPVAVAAWTPPITAMMLALGIILHLEDG